MVCHMEGAASRIVAGWRLGYPISLGTHAAPAQRLTHVPPAWHGDLRRGSTHGHRHTSVGLSADAVKL
jgi:hypothetical protein